MLTLEDADALRETDRAAALEAYASLVGAIRPDDEKRLTWICDQVAPTPPARLAPLLERVPETASESLRRAALQARATIAWYQGDGANAEALLHRALRFPSSPRDRTWIRTALNLAMIMRARGCLFEPLVLGGMGYRAAASAQIPYLTTYAALSRVEVLLEMGDLGRAANELGRASESIEQVSAAGERRVIEYQHRAAIARLCEETGDRTGALQEWDDLLHWLEDYGTVEGAIFADVHMSRLRLRFELDDGARGDVLAQWESLSERFRLGSNWADGWERDLLELRLRHAVAREDPTTATALAGELLTLLEGESRPAERVRRALRVARLLAGPLGASELARRAYELASTASLLRVVEADRSAREIPELAEAEQDDWDALRDYRARLEEEQSDLIEAVAADLRPGAAAFELLVKDEIVNICAWCSRARTRNDTWVPVTNFVPASPNFRVSHGLCADCAQRFFPDTDSA